MNPKDFNPQDLKRFSAERELHRLDSHKDDTSPIFTQKDGWTSTPIKIRVPCEKVAHASEDSAPVYEVQGLHHRNLAAVIKSAFKETLAAKFHVTPYKEFYQQSPDRPPVHIYSEIHTADAMLEEHARIRAHSRSCDLETFVIPLVLYSDSTQFTSFGNASLWPMYLYIGNLSKYMRCKPTSFSAHHLAYIPKASGQSIYLIPLYPPVRAAWRRFPRLVQVDIRATRIKSDPETLQT